MKRFQDEGKYSGDFRQYQIVHCPKCENPVDMTNQISCTHCGFSKRVEQIKPDLYYFLKIPCCGHTFRAYNLEHLDFLEKYVEADLRERIPYINKSLVSRLPPWMKEAKNRNEILRVSESLDGS